MDNEYSGRSVEEAIEKGLKELKTTRENVEIKVLNEGKSGLFGLMGSQPALVKIVPKDAPGTKEDFKQNLEEILKKLDVSAKIEQETEGEEIVLNVSTSQPAVLIGKGGKTLEALQYILRVMTKEQSRESRVSIDVENYVKKRKE
ncbi:MAG TPA: Jag N-terminal domain-containing protein, partial [bacterium]|nr:Jag N-terminal domain-containing protein [bacterium]